MKVCVRWGIGSIHSDYFIHGASLQARSQAVQYAVVCRWRRHLFANTPSRLTDRYFLRDYFTADLPFPPISYNLCSLQRDIGKIEQPNETKGMEQEWQKISVKVFKMSHGNIFWFHMCFLAHVNIFEFPISRNTVWLWCEISRMPPHEDVYIM